MKLVKINLWILSLCLMTNAFSASALAQMSQDALNRFLLNVSRSGDTVSFQQAIEFGANIDVTDEDGCTPLMNAFGYHQCLDMDIENQYYRIMIGQLIEAGAKLNSQEQLDSLLLRAAEFDDMPHIQYALIHGANIHGGLLRSSSLSPLMIVSRECNLGVARHLILAGAYVNYVVLLPEGVRQTALDIARTHCEVSSNYVHGRNNIIRLLQDAEGVPADEIPIMSVY